MNRTKKRMNFVIVLILFATVPLLVGGLISSIYLVETGKSEVREATQNSMLSLVKETGISFDYFMLNDENSAKGFIASPIVKDLLIHPSDIVANIQAQKYIVEYSRTINDCAAVYIADWNGKIISHSNEKLAGQAVAIDLEEAKKDMLESERHVYNGGIVPASVSDELVLLITVPVFDNNEPIGFVGIETYINGMATALSNVESLNLSTAYTYFVDGHGTMLFHPDPSKVGSSVENAAVKGLVAQLENGEIPEPDCIQYKYKGADKYAAYYVGAGEKYIVVLTADYSEIVKKSSTMALNAVVLDVIILLIFVGVAVFVGRLIAKPLRAITAAMKKTAEGDLNADTNIHTILSETQSLILSIELLQENLSNIIGNVKNISGELSTGAESVNTLSKTNAENSATISTVIGEIAEGATSMAESVQSIDEQAIQMGDDIDDISDNTGSLVNLSNDIKAANKEAAKYIEKVSGSSQQSVVAVHDIAKQIRETNEAIISVQEAVNMIQSVASQTNLLALNASIEAARAGEAGRGFAVVATEIGNLSVQSNNSASQINEIVKNIIAQSEKSVKLSAEVADIIAEEQKYIIDTQGKFNVLNSTIEKSIEGIKLISDKVSSLNLAKNSIITSVSELSAISQENAASTEVASNSVTEIVEGIKEISNNSEETKNMAVTLTEVVAYFR